MADHTAAESTAASIIERTTVIQMRIHGQTNRYADSFVPHWISYLTEYLGVKWIILRSRFYIDILYFKHSIFIYFTKFFNLYLCSMDDNFFLIFKSIRNLYTIFENMFYIICMDTFISSNNSSYLFFSLNFFTSLLLYHFFYIFFLCCRTD